MTEKDSKEVVVSFPLKTREVKTTYGGKEYRFKIKEFAGVESDEFIDTAKEMNVDSDKGTTSFNIRLSMLNRLRVENGVIEAYQDNNLFDIKKAVSTLPQSLYSFLVKEIDKLNKLDGIEIKNLEKE